MKIAIAGSGALGCGFGYMLQKGGNDVMLLDFWEEHIQTIREKGLTITVNGTQDNTPISVGKPHEAEGPFDIIFIFTKSMGLRHMLEEISHLLSADTHVVCLLNGLGHAETIAEYVPKKNIIMGTTLWTAGLDAPGQTHLMGEGPVEVQNSDVNGEAGAHKVVDILTECGLNGVYSQNLHFTTWRKACVNGTVNALCALLDCNIAELFATAQIEPLLFEMIGEFSRVAESEDVEINVKETMTYIEDTAEKLGSHYPSMHQDLAHKRPTEIDFLNGVVAKRAEDNGFETPYSKLITQLIHAKEDVSGVGR